MCILNQFSACHMEISLVDINTKVGRQCIFKPTVKNETYIKLIMIMGLQEQAYATPKYLIFRCTIFPHYNISSLLVLSCWEDIHLY